MAFPGFFSDVGGNDGIRPTFVLGGTTGLKLPFLSVIYGSQGYAVNLGTKQSPIWAPPLPTDGPANELASLTISLTGWSGWQPSQFLWDPADTPGLVSLVADGAANSGLQCVRLVAGVLANTQARLERRGATGLGVGVIPSGSGVVWGLTARIRVVSGVVRPTGNLVAGVRNAAGTSWIAFGAIGAASTTYFSLRDQSGRQLVTEFPLDNAWHQVSLYRLPTRVYLIFDGTYAAGSVNAYPNSTPTDPLVPYVEARNVNAEVGTSELQFAWLGAVAEMMPTIL